MVTSAGSSPVTRGLLASRAATVSHSSGADRRAAGCSESIASTSASRTASVYAAPGSPGMSVVPAAFAATGGDDRVPAGGVPGDLLGLRLPGWPRGVAGADAVRHAWHRPDAQLDAADRLLDLALLRRVRHAGSQLLQRLERRGRAGVVAVERAPRPDDALPHRRHVDVEEHAVAVEAEARARGRCRSSASSAAYRSAAGGSARARRAGRRPRARPPLRRADSAPTTCGSGLRRRGRPAVLRQRRDRGEHAASHDDQIPNQASSAHDPDLHPRHCCFCDTRIR